MNIFTVQLFFLAFSSLSLVSKVFAHAHSFSCSLQAPQWSYLLFVVGLFIYQSLDAVDGKQARRTQSATPLGELFDHGCDALSALMMGIACGSAASLGDYPAFYPVSCFVVLSLFYCSHWQAYVCGKLTFRWYVSDFITQMFCTLCVLYIENETSVWERTAPLQKCDY